ncbi:hypothetical protein [Streptomyces sp. NPDC049555]|uniref:hypothetical protein n=1 Tax=Streptomyces sp. NPDC049555 TaxID=3154930 RepID=UPI00341DF6DC
MHRSLTRRAAAALAAAAAVTVCTMTSAQAADGPAAPAPSDYTAAQQVLRSGQVHDTVARFLTATQHRSDGGADGGTSAGARRGLAAAAPGFDLKKPVPMYELAPEFVTGRARASAASALRLSYLASRVSATDGHQAAVLLAPQPAGGSWQLAGIRDGEADIAAAERGTEQARTFMEPQVHGWYRLTGDGFVEPLNKEAGVALQGASRVTLAAYQQLVAKRYGDKQPGSAYDRKGLAGGYALPEDHPAPTAASSPAGPTWLPVAGGGAALATAAAAAVVVHRRRTTA